MPEITSSEPALEDDRPAVRATACGSCGAPVEGADRFCGFCGEQLAGATETGQAASPQRHFRCENCGAEVAIDLDQRSYVCAFCDSTYVVEFTRDETDRQSPEFVIGFAVTPEGAMEKYRQWLSEKGWFRPGDLKMAQVAEKLKGVYLPFWSFSMMAQSRWSAEIGEYWYRTETYTTTENGKTVTKTRTVRETEWWDLRGNHHRYYSHYLVTGSRGLGQREADRIKPFHLAALKRYEPFYLAGWFNEEYSVQRDDALKVCRDEFYRRELQEVAAFLPGDTHQGLHVDTHFSKINSDLILLPMYLLTYRYRNKLYRFMVNGQTGKVAGDKPLSGRKIALTVVVVAAIIGVVAALFALAQ